MLTKIQEILRSQGLVRETWATTEQARADKVALYRRYFDGDHDVYLSDEMKAMLQTNLGFHDNYCELVVTTTVNRLLVRGFDGGVETVEAWAGDLLAANRFDGLQLDVHEAVVRDGNTYVLLSYDEDEQRVMMDYEPAYDGSEGMIVVYDRRGRELVAAVKIWLEVNSTRVTINYPDRDWET